MSDSKLSLIPEVAYPIDPTNAYVYLISNLSPGAQFKGRLDRLATGTANSQSASYTLAATDASSVVSFTGTAGSNLTVPPDTSINFPLGTRIGVIQTGTGVVTVVAGVGVTVNTNGSSLALNGQYAVGTLVKTAANTWVLYGGVALGNISARIQVLRGNQTSLAAVTPLDGEVAEEQNTDAKGVPYEVPLLGYNGSWYPVAAVEYNGTNTGVGTTTRPHAVKVRPFVGSSNFDLNLGAGAQNFVEGNTPGPAAVDLQVARRSATQVANGVGAFSAGLYNTSSGIYAVTLGASNAVYGNQGVAIGFANTVTAGGTAAVAIGSFATASANGAVAIGESSEATNNQAVAIAGALVSGSGSVGIGNSNVIGDGCLGLDGGSPSRDGSFALGPLATTSTDVASPGTSFWALVSAVGNVLTIANQGPSTDATKDYTVNDVIVLQDQTTLVVWRAIVTAVTATTLTISGLSNSTIAGLVADGAQITQAYLGPAWASGLRPTSSDPAFGRQMEGDELIGTTVGAQTVTLTKSSLGTTRSTYYVLMTGAYYSFDILVTAQAADASQSTGRWHRACLIKRNVAGTCTLVGSAVRTVEADILDAGLSSGTVAVTADDTNKRLQINVSSTGVAGGVTVIWDAVVTARRVAAGN